MDRVLTCLLFALSVSRCALAQVAPPVHEIQVQIRSSELLSVFNTGGTLEYKGTHTICDGGPIDILVPRINIVPQGWIMPSDGRYGLALNVDLSATLHLHSNQFLCGIDDNVQCHGSAFLIGPLADNSEMRGECATVSLGAGHVGFKLFDAPRLFETGVPVFLPECDKNKKERVCFQWAGLLNGKYVVAPVVTPPASREVHFFGRLTGNPIAPFPPDTDSVRSGSNYIGANIHVGLDSTALSSLRTLRDAEEYVSPKIDPNVGFRAVVSLDALTDDTSNPKNPGILHQILPIYIDAIGKPVLGLGVQYSMFLDKFELYRARLRGDEFLVLEGRAFKAKLYIHFPRARKLLRLPFFRSVRVRALIDSLEMAEDGTFHLKLRGVDVKARALFGLLNLGFGGPYLNKQLEGFFSKAIPVVPLSREFEISIPKCIVLDDKSPHDLDNCTGAGVMKHVAGYRGARAKLHATEVKLFVDRQTASISGSLEVTGIGANE